MGCACLFNRNNLETGNNDVKDIEEEPDNNSNNDSKDYEQRDNNSKDNQEAKQNYYIVVGNHPQLNKGLMSLDSSNNVMNRARAKSSPLNALSEEDDKNFHYKPIETNLITPEEFQEFCATHNSLNDSISVEIRPTTACENKTIYYGEWDIKKNLRHGRGIQVWPDGSKYIGYWKNNQANGKGKLIHQDGDIYEGDWQSGKPNGKGCYIHLDGSKYVGDWKNDKQEGTGEETWADGSVYNGA